MKLYAGYIKEVFGKECEYDDKCFITYKLYEDENKVSIIDYYCDPKYRGQGYVLKFMNNLITKLKKRGYKIFYGYTDKSCVGWERREELILKFGFKHLKVEDSTYNHYILEIQENYNGQT